MSEYPYSAAAIILSAAIHELGHIAAARALGIKLSGFSLTPTEARIHTAGLLPYAKEWAVAAAGPLANLLTALLLLPAVSRGSFVGKILLSSLTFAAFNLLPIAGFDGGRMLFCLASLVFPPGAARAILRVLSLINIVGLWMISVYFLIRTASALSLFMFSVTLFVHLKGQ